MSMVDTAPPPIERRLLGLDRRKILPSLGVVALVVFWAGIIPAIDEAITADQIEPGTEFTLVNGVRFSPAAGWNVDGVPAPSSPTLSVFDGGVTFEITSGLFEGSPEELLETIEELDDNLDVTGTTRPFSTASGLPGAGVELVGPDYDGALFAVVAVNPNPVEDGESVGALDSLNNIGIEVVVEGPPGALQERTEAIGEMIASIAVEFPSTGGAGS